LALYRYSGKRLAEAYKREPIRGIQSWAEKEVVFTDLEVSPILGNFKVKYSPHYIKLFQLIDRTLTRELFAKWASQSGKSLFGVLVAAHKLDTLPATVLYAQPLKDDVSVILQTKINPVLKSIPKLWKKFEDYKESEKVRTKDAAKKLAGGNFLVKGSGTKDRKSQTSPFIVLDEIGEFEEGAVFEFKERTKSFTKFHPKVIGVSTIVHDEDEICTNFNSCSVKIEWHYICMKCKTNFYPDIKQFKYKSKENYLKENNLEEEEIVLNRYIDEAKATVHIECPHCEHKINTAEKDVMIAQQSMDWYIKHENGKYELLEIDNLSSETSFGADMNSFGSFFVTYEDMVENIIKAGDDPVKLDKLYRGWFNRFYEHNVEKVNEDDLLLLGNGLKDLVVPKDTIKLYMGVDTQTDHFWYEIKAYTYGDISHSIASGRLESFENIEQIWEQGQSLEDEDGNPQMISKMGIDRMGDRTYEVDAFVEYMVNKWKNGDNHRIFATMGKKSLSGTAPYLFKNTKDMSTNRNKIDIKVIVMDTTYLKNKIALHIERTIAMCKAETEEDKGFEYKTQLFYINQDTINADMESTTSISYTRQINAETYDFHKSQTTGKIEKEKSWGNPHQRDNHFLDTSVICEVFAEVDKIRSERKSDATGIANSLKGLSSLGS